MVYYDYQFLKERGFFENQGKFNEDRKDIIVDTDNYLAYMEVNNNNEVEELKKLILNKYPKIELLYFHYQTDNKIKVFRRTGGIKWFYYSDTISKLERKKSKQDKLKKFSPDDVDTLFDIKDVMDKFYKDLWAHRLEMAKSITESLTDNDKLFIAQHFIDRLVFFYFLAQLGVIEVNIDNNGRTYNYKLNKTGTKDFFNLLLSSFEDDKLHQLLNKIFFEGLGNNENAVDGFVELTIPMNNMNIIIKAPYLNGGLYRVKKFNGIDETNIKFDGIKNLIETLNQYDWVIGEYAEEDDDSVGSLTPEVMGYVYEKFVVGLENIGEIKLDEIEVGKEVKIGRKKVGAFYTPEEITKYISENTITPYLFDRLKVSEKYDDFNEFVDNGTPELLKKSLEVLNDIKILDPACGSGHFLVCAGELLFNMKNTICEKLEKKDDSFNRKHNAYIEIKNIIVDNLYGVDICDSAVEITKLRLWLWLISQLNDSSSKLEPLPNLEYNIKCGNSLIGWVDEELAQISLNNPYNDEVKGILKGLRVAFKGKDREDIDNAKDFFNSHDLNKYIDCYCLLYKLYRKSHGEEANYLKKILETIRVSMYNSITSAFLDYINMKIKPKYSKNKPPIAKEEFDKLQVFHWKVDFGWIIKNGGFDIVIGNPPYGNILKGIEKKILEEGKILDVIKTDKKGKGTKNAAAIFIERSKSLLNSSGYFGFIVPKAILYVSEWEKTRKFLLEKVNIKRVVDNGKAFKDVKLEMATIIFKNNSGYKNTNNVVVHSLYLDNYSKYSTNPYSINIKYLTSKRFITEMDEEKEKIISIILKDSVLLGDISENYKGLSVNNKVSSEKTENSVEILRGNDIQRCYLRSKSYIDKKYLENINFKGSNLQFQEILAHIQNPKPHIKITGVYLEEPLLNLNTITNIKLTSDEINDKYLLLLLHSELINWYVYKYIYINSIRTMHFSGSYIEDIPIKLSDNQDMFVKLCNCLILLNQTEYRYKYNEIITYIENIANLLIYELYLGEEVIGHELTKLLSGKILKLKLEDISSIEKFILELKDNQDIQRIINDIKNNNYVKIIRGLL
ncbi:DNA methyltransferase [Methanothermococcus sp. Ax23]|uniref:Eco57I restriction-modification methylase domain-containing protein n=1 Tax=Methanothermococcus sp. Ax23 TaxID=3156486 RepID=UPI003BA29D23